jgi:hypothetical protein
MKESEEIEEKGMDFADTPINDTAVQGNANRKKADPDRGQPSKPESGHRRTLNGCPSESSPS